MVDLSYFFFPLVFISVDDNFESVSQVGSTVSFFIGYIIIVVVVIFIIIIIVIIDYFQIEALNLSLLSFQTGQRRPPVWPSGFDSESKTTLSLHNLGKMKIILCNFQKKLHSHLFRKAIFFWFLPFILCYLSRILWVFLLLGVIWASKETTSNLANDLVHFITVARQA